MKKVIFSYLIAGTILLILSYALLLLAVLLFPSFAEQYYSPMFASSPSRTILYFIHPFILAIALKYFWQRFKPMFKGHFIVRGHELGLVYALIATLPAMWLLFSTIKVSTIMIVSWFIYGLLQATIAGIIYAKTNP